MAGELTLERISELEEAERESFRGVSHPELMQLFALARRALEQPAPTGEELSLFCGELQTVAHDRHRLEKLVGAREAAAYQRGLNERDERCLQSDMQRIREKLAYERGLSARGEWIAVTERLPEPSELVQFWVRGFSWDSRFVGTYSADRGDGFEWEDLTDQGHDGECATYSHERVTHWRCLPSPPEGGKHGR